MVRTVLRRPAMGKARLGADDASDATPARLGWLESSMVRPMLTDTLCTRCGLCCDGTLLGDVELAGAAEATRLEALGLAVDDDEAGAELLPLPCAALRGTRCGIYAHRPGGCRAFVCRLLQDTERGVVSVDDALAHIAQARAQVRRVHTLLAQVEAQPARLPLAERCADAIASVGHGPRGARQAAAIETAMGVVTRTIRATFLEG